MKKIKEKLSHLNKHVIYRKFSFLSVINNTALPVDPEAKFVVSIASYPKRSHLLPAIFEALSRQTVLPAKWILVLSEEEWPDLILPEYIQKLVRRNLEIIWVKNNTYAVKKLLPVMEKYPDYGVIALDDDQIYHPGVIANLIQNEYARKSYITGHIGMVLHKKGQSLNMMYRENERADEKTPSQQVYFIGWGGVYYPPASLDKRAFDMNAINKIVPGRGSDIWFWAAALANGTRQVCVRIPKKLVSTNIPLNSVTAPKEWLDNDQTEVRFQKAIDHFDIRKKLLEELPDRG
ncbi:hypothetical protein [Natronogracilivirga saccharolytica]|uniref:Glycosyl transferase family 2 n=1 Tax=Natronogracilivirga saccharolytica TaxID=2812953 RepID=A0A8J7SBB9_9BACT|nr:hypothetical protein [Natronogracilivirga saccharolytica]MBP3193943.1 hypothetical protein [Natronogracilivirga saccharolytica]